MQPRLRAFSFAPFIVVACFAACWLLAPREAVSAAPQPTPTFLLHGRLTSAVGEPVITSTTATVKIYDAASVGNLLYSEEHTFTPSGGFYRLAVGSGANPVGAANAAAAVRSAGQVWITLEVASEGDMEPRIPLGAVGYAANAYSIQGHVYCTDSAAANGTPSSGYTPSAGDMWFDTGNGALKVFDGTTWR